MSGTDRTSGPATTGGRTGTPTATPTAGVLAPTDLRDAAEALAGTTGPVRLTGAGTADGWADDGDHDDAGGRDRDATATVLDTTGLRGVLAHNPADMTVSVRAGTPLRELAAELARTGQRVAFDAPRVLRGATVGGLIATADAGPLAHAYGSMRDLVIGATVVLADGTVARTGGHVIKNVAGYDLAKLMHGSYGAFGLLAEVVLRLHPVPAATRTVCVECPLPEVTDRTRAVLSGAAEPVSVEWVDDLLLVRLEGPPEGTEARARHVAEQLGGRVLTEDDADAAWARHAEVTERGTVRVGCRPSRLPGVVAGSGCAGAGRAAVGPATGVATLVTGDMGGTGDTGDADDTADTDDTVGSAVEAVHDAVDAVGGTSVVRARPPAGVRAWNRAPSAVRVLRALKDELDPHRRLNPGRFGSWLDTEEAGP